MIDIQRPDEPATSRRALLPAFLVGAGTMVLQTDLARAASGGTAAPRAPATDGATPFRVRVEPAEVSRPRHLLRLTRWSDKEGVGERSQAASFADVGKLVHWNKAPQGGHFAAFERLGIFVEEPRRAKRTLA